ncbi:MAG: hypothetical protein GX154_11275 [Clostridiales bacterium]|nr:hypothetical protein [Clostridiales bacterium]
MNVFVAGPRVLKSLNEDVKHRLVSLKNKNITVLVGDANGIDRLTQQHFSDLNYKNVIVYASAGKVRNNIGNWKVKNVKVEDNLKGFNFYAAKDIQMAEDADYGFMIWNGRSKGTLNNMINLLNRSKKVLLYFAPNGHFYNIEALDMLEKFLNSMCHREVLDTYHNLTGSDVKQISFSNMH